MTEVSNQQLSDLLKQVREGAKNSLRDVFNAISDPGTLIRDGASGSAYNGLGVEIVRGVCRSWASGKHPLGGVPAVDGFYGSLCKPYLESIGQWSGEGDLSFPNYLGGQCDVLYNAFATGEVISSNTGASFPFNDALGMAGPVTQWFYYLDGTDLRRKYVDANFPPPGSNSIVRSNVASFTINQSLVRQDGQPDDCGNPPVEYDSPYEPTDPGGEEPVNVPGPYGDFNVNVSFGDNGDVIICPQDSPDVPCVSIPGPSEPKGPQNPINTGPQSPADQGNPGNPAVVSEGESASGEAPEGSVLVGVRVELISAVSPAREEQTSNGNFYRGSCYVYLGGDGGLDQQSEAAIIRFPQFFYAPEVSTKWTIFVSLGYTLRVIPYYREVDR